jgi:uncharacterized protein
MKYEDSDAQSTNVEDRRGSAEETDTAGGFPIPMGGGGMGLTTMLIVGAIMLLFGLNPLDLLNGGMGQPGPSIPSHPRVGGDGREGGRYGIPGLPGSAEKNGPRDVVARTEDPMKVRVAQVLKDTEDVWTEVFQSMGKRYTAPKLVIFSRATRTGCGVGQTAMGPFYCPLDQQVYIDLAFYDELKRRFNAPGDFAQAYVIAHEVGHHVQTLLGISDQVQRQKSRASERQSNAIQVRMELQADCYAGVWAARDYQLHKDRIQPGDIESGLNAAAQIGDDTLQKKSQGYVVPDAFTHGSSAQRVGWFKQGMRTGQLQSCDTFGTRDDPQ